jgi:predicted nucleic acid-binding protein
MTTAIDTNVLVALWNEDDRLNRLAQSALDAALGQGGLVISAPVFAELLAAPSRNEAFLDSFCQDTGIVVEWKLDEAVWRAAGRAFQAHAIRRRRHRFPGPRRILADFVIGAHALRRGYRLLTLDDTLYRSAFPHLSLVAI